MGLTLLDKALWLAGFAGYLVLLYVLVSRRRIARFPFFSAYIAFQVITAILDFAAHQWSTPVVYYWTYWSLVSLDAVLQLGVVYEMAHEVLRPAGQWVHSTRMTFLSLGCGGAFTAAALSFAVDPQSANTLTAWSIRFNLFTSLLIAELVIAMFLAATRVGLQWRNYVMGIAEGMAPWVCISICVDTAHSYWGWTQNYIFLEHLRMFSYLAALAYWCISFWRTEPARTKMPSELQRYLDAVGHSLEYDLHKVSKTRKKS